MNREKMFGKKKLMVIIGIFLGCVPALLSAADAPQEPVSVPVATATSAPEPTPTPNVPVNAPAPTEKASAPVVATSEPTPPTPVALPVEVPAPVEAPAQAQTAASEGGIDTIDIEEGGNWLLKRQALEETVNLIEEINGLFTKILQVSTEFKISRNKLDNEHDLFIATIGFNLGDFDELLVMLLDELEKDKVRDGDESAGERAAEVTIAEKKKELELLQTDLKMVETIDDELDTVVSTVDNQLKTANNYQTQAWKNFQTIKKVLSDEKAAELQYATKGLYDSMKDIYTYLTQNLETYFSTQLQAARDQMSKIQSSALSLQQKGVDLKNSLDKLRKKEEQVEKQALEAKAQEEIQKALAQAGVAKKSASWWQKIGSVLSYPFGLLKSAWDSVTGWIGGWFGKKTQIVPTVQVTEPPVSVPAPETTSTPATELAAGQPAVEPTSQPAGGLETPAPEDASKKI